MLIKSSEKSLKSGFNKSKPTLESLKSSYKAYYNFYIKPEYMAKDSQSLNSKTKVDLNDKKFKSQRYRVNDALSRLSYDDRKAKDRMRVDSLETIRKIKDEVSD